ncbi:CIA30 family protein [uncultured Thiodictyon sp.]|uniref:CIA30 family protein n=1 Tax=uncultured Thiodictyon sp. TaxID=1846217 RepID=UPI0025E91DED|nr:CIA30 family protein [uncultured Thiodictyon sp.]
MTPAPDPIIDDRTSGNLNSNLGTRWQCIADTVMGGVSRGGLAAEAIDGCPCLHLTGQVSLANNGGFVQAGLDLRPAGLLDARGWSGIELVVRGNDETYNLHLRTVDTRIVWQSYRASFRAGPQWETVRLPFADFTPYRIDRPLDLSTLRRLGLVAIGRAMAADLSVSRIAFYSG